MTEVIQDGTGKGYFAKVNQFNQLTTSAITEPEDKFRNKDGYQWSLSFTVTPVGAGDYFFYLTNTGDNDISITDFRFSSASAEVIYIDAVTGTPSYTSGTALTPQPKNLGSNREASITCYQDTDTTGLTKEGELFFVSMSGANDFEQLRTSANVIIPKGTALALRAITGGIALRGVVSIVESVSIS